MSLMTASMMFVLSISPGEEGFSVGALSSSFVSLLSLLSFSVGVCD